MLFMEAIGGLLESEFEVVSMIADGGGLLRKAFVVKPDLVLLELAIPSLNGLEAGRSLKANLPGIKLVYLTADPDSDAIDEAFWLGASAYLFKSCHAIELLSVVRRALLHSSYLSPFVIGRKIAAPNVAGVETHQTSSRSLTSRQREVLKLLVSGRSMKEVAFTLRISARTVAYHKYRIMDDFKLGSSAALVKFAMEEQVA